MLHPVRPSPSDHSANPATPEIVLHYTAFKQIADDIDNACIYGRVHYRFNQEAAVRQGWRVGEYILQNELQSLHGRDCDVAGPKIIHSK